MKTILLQDIHTGNLWRVAGFIDAVPLVYRKVFQAWAAAGERQKLTFVLEMAKPENMILIKPTPQEKYWYPVQDRIMTLMGKEVRRRKLCYTAEENTPALIGELVNADVGNGTA